MVEVALTVGAGGFPKLVGGVAWGVRVPWGVAVATWLADSLEIKVLATLFITREVTLWASEVVYVGVTRTLSVIAELATVDVEEVATDVDRNEDGISLRALFAPEGDCEAVVA